MKKTPTIVIVLIAVLTLALCALALAGCGGSNEESNESSGTGGTSNGTSDKGGGNSADIAACQANLRTIDSAMAQYKAANGKNPTSIQALVPDYLRSVPKNPWGEATPSAAARLSAPRGISIEERGRLIQARRPEWDFSPAE